MKKSPIATLANAALWLGFASAYEPAVEETSLVLRKFEFDPSSSSASMTWHPVEGRAYVIEELADPKLGWRQYVGEVQRGAGETNWTFQTESPSQGTTLFRVRELSAVASNDDRSKVNARADLSLFQRRCESVRWRATLPKRQCDDERSSMATSLRSTATPDGQAAGKLKLMSLFPRRGIS